MRDGGAVHACASVWRYRFAQCEQADADPHSRSHPLLTALDFVAVALVYELSGEPFLGRL